MSYSKACCTIAPVESNYSAVGVIEKVGDMDCYVVGPADSKKAIVVMYDIFGMHNNTKQFADLLAKYCNYKVVMPDFFRGETCPESALGDMETLMAWVNKHASYEIAVDGLKTTKDWLRSTGIVAGGVVGFCWGAKMAAKYSAVDIPRFFEGIVMVHPSFVDLEDAKIASAPVLALPSKDEPDMTEYMEVLAKKPFGDKCQHHRFDDMHHGFAGARGDFNDELNVKRVTEAIQLTVNFLNTVISDNHPNL